MTRSPAGSRSPTESERRSRDERLEPPRRASDRGEVAARWACRRPDHQAGHLRSGDARPAATARGLVVGPVGVARADGRAARAWPPPPARDPFLMVDLHVYVDGARHLTDGTLYDFFSAAAGPAVHLPAVLGDHLHADDVATVDGAAGRCGSSPRSGRSRSWPTARCASSGAPGRRRRIRSSTCGGSSSSPPRSGCGSSRCARPSTTARSTCSSPRCCSPARWPERNGWPAPASGSRPGIKLTPAITGLYYLLQMRDRRGGLVGGVLRRHGRGRGRHPAERDLALSSPNSSSIRPAPDRSGPRSTSRCAVRSPGSLGDDNSGAWLFAAVPAAVLGLWASWVCLRAGDRCAAFLAVQFTGLLRLADLLVAPLGVGAAAAAVVPVRTAAAAHLGAGARRSRGSSRPAATW